VYNIKLLQSSTVLELVVLERI